MTSATHNPIFQVEYLTAVLSSIDDSVVVTDEKFIIRYCNPKAEQLFGFKASEVVGRRAGEVLGLKYPEGSAEAARVIVRSTGTWKGKVYFQNKHNQLLLLDTSVTAVKNENGNTEGFVAIHRDVTGIHQTATALSTLLSMVSSVDDYFFMLDRNMKLVWVNESANKKAESDFGIYYKTGEDFVSKMPAERQQQVRQALQKALDGEKASYEARLLPMDGKEVWVEANYFPVKDQNGNVFHVCGMVRNITDKKEEEQSKQSLYRSRLLFETFMENSPIMSWITDKDGMIKYLSPSYLKTYNLTKEVIGTSITKVFPTAINTALLENNHKVYQSRQPLAINEYATTPDGVARTYQVIKFPVETDDDIYIGGWAIDITEESKLRKTLSDSLSKLQASEINLKEALTKEHQLGELKSRFVTMASHEFRTPLSTMLSSIYLLERYGTTEQQANRLKHSGKIKEAIQHLNNLLDDFLTLGKLEEGKTSVDQNSFNLHQLLNEIIEELEPVKKSAQVIHYTYSGEHSVTTDKKIIRNVLLNLLNNAIKFSRENGRIWLDGFHEDGHMRITVRDEGIGIAKDDQKHIFQTFFRAKNAQNIQGTGLGLHIVRQYLDLLQGSIELQSELNKGTLVNISFPVGE